MSLLGLLLRKQDYSGAGWAQNPKLEKGEFTIRGHRTQQGQGDGADLPLGWVLEAWRKAWPTWHERESPELPRQVEEEGIQGSEKWICQGRHGMKGQESVQSKPLVIYAGKPRLREGERFPPRPRECQSQEDLPVLCSTLCYPIRRWSAGAQYSYDSRSNLFIIY